MSAHLEMVREIGATPERVWEVLTDLTEWDSWNPTLSQPQGELVEGSTVRMNLKLGRRSSAMRQEIVEVSPPSVLRWRSLFGPKWMFSVLRTFRIDPAGDDRSRFEQSEVGTGVFARLIFMFTGPPTVRGYAALAEALERRLAEQAT